MQEINITIRNGDSTATPRARCIVEFVEGDVNRAPVVYPLGGSDEIDAAMREAILKKWEHGKDE